MLVEFGLHILIYFSLRDKKYEDYEILFGLLVNSFIIINAICPLPFDNFKYKQDDYKKVPLFTVITGIVENISWLVIYYLYFAGKFTGTSGIIGNFVGACIHLVHLGFYKHWKNKNDEIIECNLEPLKNDK